MVRFWKHLIPWYVLNNSLCARISTIKMCLRKTKKQTLRHCISKTRNENQKRFGRSQYFLKAVSLKMRIVDAFVVYVEKRRNHNQKLKNLVITCEGSPYYLDSILIEYNYKIAFKTIFGKG